ncbi:hypothetical protein JM47_00500 [Ureaplasma diversum]|uniref:Peptidase S8/S53 domain-containing protein n=1 Tax=Ureaplasma diversum TaxID=42094 RepID=A0A0C5RKE8_9BACT|nr:S8 family serine peptidase [Ureaplasma diversum]AJQ45138.1 hypothetical protein JM47_00500 [Ureaplasma diversum]
MKFFKNKNRKLFALLGAATLSGFIGLTTLVSANKYQENKADSNKAIKKNVSYSLNFNTEINLEKNVSLIKTSLLKNDLNETSISLNTSTKSLTLKFNQIYEQKVLDLINTLRSEIKESFFILNNMPENINDNQKQSISSNSSFKSVLEDPEDNEKHYAAVGLNKETRDFLIENFGDEKVKVGIMEVEGFISADNENIFPNREVGDINYLKRNGQNTNVKSDHANWVAEVIGGNLGINSNAKLYSIYYAENTSPSDYFNLLTNSKVNILNNSWGPKYAYLQSNYSRLPKDIDDSVFSNPEIINIFAAGNQYNGKTTTGENGKKIEIPPYKYLAGGPLSINSIVVGAYDLETKEKTSYSQIGNDVNYITVIAPGNNFRYTNKNGGVAQELIHGTSFAAPVVSGLLSFVYQSNKDMFDLGSDSIIAKSALISGSERLKSYHSLYTPETGFGVPNFDLVNEAVSNLWYFKNFKRGKELVQLYLKEGQTLRTNISWLVKNINNKADFTLKVEEPSTLINYSDTKWNIETVEMKANQDGWYNIFIERKDDSASENPDVALTYVIK